jgi:hypothetical protein
MWILLFIKEENKMVLIYTASILYIMVSMWILVFSKDKNSYLLSLVPYIIMVGGVAVRLGVTFLLPFPVSFIETDIQVLQAVLVMAGIGFGITSVSNLLVNS